MKIQDLQLQVVDLLAYLVVTALVMKFNKKPVTETPLDLTLPIVQLLLLPPQPGLVKQPQFHLPTLNIIATPLLATSLTQLLITAIPLPV
jgi:hypothetical protein